MLPRPGSSLDEEPGLGNRVPGRGDILVVKVHYVLGS